MFLFAAGGASAATTTYTWNGAAAPSNSNFSAGGVGGNWTSSAAPTSSTNSLLVFGGTAGLTPNNDQSSFTYGSITFNNTAGQFVIGGNAFTLNGVTNSIVNNSGVLQTINNGITLGQAETFNGGTGGLTLGGTVTIGSRTLTLSGSGPLSVAAITGSTGAVSVTATGTTTLSSLASFSGGLTINGANANVLLTGANTYTGATTVNRGFLGLSGSGSISTGNLSLASTGGSGGSLFGATGTFSRAFGTGGSQVQLSGTNGSGFVAYGGNLTLSGLTGTWGTTTGFFSASTGPLIFNDSSHANGMVDWQGNFSLGTAARTITVNDNAGSTADWARISGTITTGGGGSLIKNGAGTLELTANNSGTATSITVNEGVLALSGSGQLFSGNLSLAGSSGTAPAVLAASGTFSRALGTGNNQVQLSGTNGAGFAAYGGALNLTGLNGATWGTTTGFFSASSGPLVFGDDVFANNVVDWQGSFSLGTAARTITVLDNPNSANDYAKISGTISSGAGASLTKNGTGLLQLAAANTYSGSTTVSAGTLQYGINNALPTTTALTVASGATLDLKSYDGTIGSLTGAGTVDLSGSSVNKTLTVGDSTSTTFSGTITDSGAGSTLNLTKQGSGALTLSGTNTYTGNTTINGGTLVVSSDSNLGTAPGSPSAANVTLGNGTLEASTGFTLNSNRGITLTASTTGNLTADANQLLSYGGTITGSGNISFGTVTTGTGAVSLSGSSNYTGTTTITAGSLRFGANNALPTATAVTVGTNGTLDLYTFNGTIGSLAGSGTVDLSQASQTKTLTLGDANNTTFSGVIANSGAGSTLNLVKQGAGTLTLSGTNIYTGSTTINNGILKISADSGLGNAPGSVTPGDLTLGGGKLETTASFTLNSNRGIALTTATSSNITADTGTTLSYGGVVAGSGNITYGTASTGTGTVVLTGTSTNTGATTLAAGTLSINSIANGGAASALGQASNAAGNLVFAGGTLKYAGTDATPSTDRNFTINAGNTMTVDVANSTTNLTMSGSTAAANNGALTKNGSGTLTLTGTNLYTGQTTLNAGTLAANSTGALGASSGDIVVNAGTLSLGAGLNFTRSGNLSLAGSGASASTGALHGGITSGTTNIYLGNASLTANATISAGAGLLQIGDGNAFTNTLTLSGNTLSLYTPSAPTVTPVYPYYNPYLFDPSNIVTYSQITGTGGVNKSGAGTATIFAGTIAGNTFTGDTNVTAGTLILDGGTNRPVINSNQVYVGNSSSPGAQNSVVLQMGQAVSPPASNNIIGTWNSNTNGSTSSITIYEDGLLNLNKGSNGFTNITLKGGHITGLDATANPNVTFTGTLTSQASSNTAVIEQGNLRISGNALTFSIAAGSAPAGLDGRSDDLRIDDVLQTWTNGGFGYTAGASGTSLSKTGLGKLILTNSNTYAGITDITAGIVNIRAGDALGQTGNTLTDTGNGTIVRNNAQLQLQGGITVNGFETLTLNGSGYNGASDGALRNVGGNNTYNGYILLNSATANRINADSGTTLTIGSNPAANIMDGVSSGKNLTVGGAGDTIINGGIATNVANISKDGAGTLTLAGANTYTGTTTVTAGAVKVTNHAGLSGTGVTVSNNTELQFAQNASNQNISVAAVPASIQGTGTSGLGAIRNLSGNNQYAGAITLANDATISAAAGTSLEIKTGGFVNSNKTVTFGTGTQTGNITVSGNFYNSGTPANVTNVIKDGGSSTLTLSGTGTNKLGTVAINSGTVAVGSGTTLTTGAVSSAAGTTLSIASGGTVNASYLAGTTTYFHGTMDGTGTFSMTGASSTAVLVFDNAAGFGSLIGNNLTLSGGTVKFTGGGDFLFNTITITGNTILDFGSSYGTVLSSTNLILVGSATVTVNNWVSAANDAANSTIWKAQNVTINGSTVTMGSGDASLSQISFSGYSGYTTTWVNGNHSGWFDHEIRPTPEPATYGLMFLSGSFGLLGLRRYLRRKRETQR